MTPFLSIIIPAYNAARFIAECINSIQNQDFGDYEIIIVNDGSSDNTLEICKKISNADSRIMVITHNNHGVSYSRNIGLEYARGKYVWFIDADDVLPNLRMSQMVKSVRDLSYPQIIRGEYSAIDENGTNLFSSHPNIKTHSQFINVTPETFFSKCVQYDFFLWLLWIRRDAISELRFPDGRIYMEDSDFICNLLNKIDSSAYTSSVIYLYRKYSGAASSSLSYRKVHDIETLLYNISTLYKNCKLQWQKEYYFKIANNSFLIIMDFLHNLSCNARLKIIDDLKLNQLLDNLSRTFYTHKNAQWDSLLSKGYHKYFRKYGYQKYKRMLKLKIKSLISKFFFW